MKKLLGVDTLYLDSQKRLKNLMNHFKYNKVKKPGVLHSNPGLNIKDFNNYRMFQSKYNKSLTYFP